SSATSSPVDPSYRALVHFMNLIPPNRSILHAQELIKCLSRTLAPDLSITAMDTWGRPQRQDAPTRRPVHSGGRSWTRADREAASEAEGQGCSGWPLATGAGRVVSLICSLIHVRAPRSISV